MQCRVADCTERASVFVKVVDSVDSKLKRIYVCKKCAELIETERENVNA